MNKSMPPQEASPGRACTVRKLALLSLILTLCAGCKPGEVPPDPAPDSHILSSDVQQASYGMGYRLSQKLRQQAGSVLDVDAFVLGVEEAFAGKPMQLSDAQVASAMNSLKRKKEMADSEQGAKNKAQGKAFLAQNSKKEGVVTLASGLQYRILVKGNGAIPSATDSVTTHYQGTLIDGTVFDSSLTRGKPAVFLVNRVIAGWTEALQLMPVGSKWRLFIPPELAYGERTAGPKVGPNSTLIFDVELLKINTSGSGSHPT